jgi:hypothetical protein
VTWFAEQIRIASQQCCRLDPSVRKSLRRDYEKENGKITDARFEELLREQIFTDPDQYLGKFRKQLLDDLRKKAPAMTRERFKPWLETWMEKMRDADVADLIYLDLHFQFTAKLDEVWPVRRCPAYAKIDAVASFQQQPLPASFLQLGGKPKWVQDEDIPICPGCDRDMQLVVQLTSPYEHPLAAKLQSFHFHDAGRLYLFGCQDCGNYATRVQGH